MLCSNISLKGDIVTGEKNSLEENLKNAYPDCVINGELPLS